MCLPSQVESGVVTNGVADGQHASQRAPREIESLAAGEPLGRVSLESERRDHVWFLLYRLWHVSLCFFLRPFSCVSPACRFLCVCSGHFVR